MSILSLLILASLTLTDPTGDAFGDGELIAPTSPIYANPAIFDIHELQVERLDGEGPLRPAEVRLTLAGVRLDPTMASGFAGAIFDIYIDTGEGGIESTLPGPGMLMPPNSGWEYALRLGPDAAFAVAHDLLVPEPDEEESARPVPAGVRLPDGSALARVPLTVVIDGNTLRVLLPWNLPAQFYAYAVSGVHDSFSASGWRQLAQAPSPWAFSGGNQSVPVIDLVANSQAEQVRALQEGVLPRVGGTTARGWPWLLLMGSGVGLAFYGLWQRRRSPAPPVVEKKLRTGLPPEVPEDESSAPSGRSETPGSAEKKRRKTGLPPLPVPSLTTPAIVAAEVVAAPGLSEAPVEVVEQPVEAVEPPVDSVERPVDSVERAADPVERPIRSSLSGTPMLGRSLAVDPFERLVLDSEEDARSPVANDLDTVDHSQMWGRKRAEPSILKVETAAEPAETAQGSAAEPAAESTAEITEAVADSAAEPERGTEPTSATELSSDAGDAPKDEA